ncbi:hypothetical protein KUV50_14010 [Membranicola marinus]|uniref:Uncharacterized protein n=1 Tax=Membranihabitans marinus TaxID=1227546 RepID=A0A953LB12_9BACT|nr:hypothetical protein [Membranihabitans marinus]MBY5959263.1 hypothetical protein [Membranihabitans marinus]
MIRKFPIVILLLLFPFISQTQNEIEVVYDDHSRSIKVNPAQKVIEAGKQYRLKITSINPVYIQDRIYIRSYRYISPTPEILEPLLPGIPGTDVFDHFEVIPSGQREFFLKSLQFFNELEVLRSASDELYQRTRHAPDPDFAKETLEHIQSVFDTTELQDIVRQIAYFQDYIRAAESIYKTNIKKITLRTPDTDIVLREYARLTRIMQKTQQINYIQLLDYIVRSVHAVDNIYSDVFTGQKDVTEIRLGLYDHYINDTIYSGILRFHTEQNWRVNFSSGLFYTNLHTRDYYLRERTETINDIVEETNFKGDISVGALLHFSYKVKANVSIGPALGASISPLDGKIRYLGGLGTILGKKRIFSINAGISIGKLSVLSGQIPIDQTGPYLPASSTKIPRYARTKAGFFVSLSYNLTQFGNP